MKSWLILLSGLLIVTPVAAQDVDSQEKGPNPYLDTPAPSLRQRLADLAPVFQEKWYQVEALIFARVNPATHEYWRLDQEPEFVPNPIYLAGMPRPEVTGAGSNGMQAAPADIDAPLLPAEADQIDRAAVDNGAWRPLDRKEQEKKVMAAMRERMERRGSYRILFHESWRQPIRERGRAFALHVEGGEHLEPIEQTPLLTPLNPPAEDNGEPPQPAQTAADDPAGEQTTGLTPDGNIPAPDRSFPEMRGELKLYLARYLHVEPNLWFTDESSSGERFHVVIEQHRRMRSEELHYIDHPLFGLVLYIKPWKTPEQEKAEQMKKALEKQMQRDDG